MATTWRPTPRFGDVQAARTLGRDLPLDGRPDMAALLRAIDAIRDATVGPPSRALRFVTSHPWDLSSRLIDAMAECDSVCEHLHLPVQAGDDAVLHRMGRQYTVDAYLDLVGRLRAAVPDIALTTDIIVGFCGETDAQFQQTLELLRTVRYDAVFAAAFSPRPGHARQPPADDVPAAVEATAAQRAARSPGRHRPRAQPSLGRPDRGGPRGPGPAAPVPRSRRRRRTRRRRAWPDGRGTTSSSTSMAVRSSWAASCRSPSTTQGRTR